MNLLEECIARLGDSCTVLTEETSNKIFEKFQQIVPFTSWGRIEWKKISRKTSLKNIELLVNRLGSQECFVLWDEHSLPVIKTEFKSIAAALDDVLAVSFDTWVLSSSYSWVIEFYHEGEPTIGYLETNQRSG